MCSLGASDHLWADLHAENLHELIASAEPIEKAIPADEPRLDRIARAFALVVDAKSSFTYHHSDRVGAMAEAIAGEIGLPDAERIRVRRAGLLHDIGKLSVPNRILDKSGKLDAGEWAVVRRHPHYTYEILARVPIFSEFAYDASNHHERVDGTGYFRGIGGDGLSRHARILATADVYDALSASRPYRGALPTEKVLSMLGEARGTHLCPVTVDAVYALAARDELIASA